MAPKRRGKPLAMLVLVLAFASPTHAQWNLFDIPDPDPEIERKSFQVADGFEVNLFAADPVLAKPILSERSRMSPVRREAARWLPPSRSTAWTYPIPYN